MNESFAAQVNTLAPRPMGETVKFEGAEYILPSSLGPLDFNTSPYELSLKLYGVEQRLNGLEEWILGKTIKGEKNDRDTKH